jgi:hypothetical protein
MQRKATASWRRLTLEEEEACTALAGLALARRSGNVNPVSNDLQGGDKG